MATIKITEAINGSFPAQNATLVLDLLTVRTSTGDQKSYAMKSAISSLKIVSEQGDNVTFDMGLRDGSHFKAEADKRTVTYLMKFVGAESSAPYVITRQAKEPTGRGNLLAWLIVILVPSWLLYQCVSRTGYSTYTPPKPAQSQEQTQELSPEELAKQQKAVYEEELRQEKVAKAAAAANTMQGIKNSELLLEGAELDLKNGKLNDIDAYGIGAMLEVIYSMAHALQEGWTNQEYLTPADISHMKSAEAKLSSFQQRAFPKLRLAFKKQAATTLWEHDVTVSISGSGNSTLAFFGYWFAANANIKFVQEQLDDMTSRLRFKRLIFAPSANSRGSQYTLTPPEDAVVATYSGRFQKISRAQAKR